MKDLDDDNLLLDLDNINYDCFENIEESNTSLFNPYIDKNLINFKLLESKLYKIFPTEILLKIFEYVNNEKKTLSEYNRELLTLHDYKDYYLYKKSFRREATWGNGIDIRTCISSEKIIKDNFEQVDKNYLLLLKEREKLDIELSNSKKSEFLKFI